MMNGSESYCQLHSLSFISNETTVYSGMRGFNICQDFGSPEASAMF